MTRTQTVSTPALLVLVAFASTALSAPRVTFADNRLQVDAQPFFFYGCWGTPNRDYTEFRRRHFNTAFMSCSSAPKDGPDAAAAGLMVVPYPHAPGWNATMKAAAQAVSTEDWVLAWNIGDDLQSGEHIQAALKVRDELRDLDPQKRPIMFDAIGLYEDFARIPDMWCAYAYALVRPAASAPPARKPTGLAEYGDWLRRMRLLGRPDGFFWTWAQCHVQIWYSEKFLGGSDKDRWRPSRFPDGDHLRLIAAHSISAGARGLMWFVYHYFQDDHLGRDRYARAAVIGCELDVVGPLIAAGRTGDRLETSNPDVWATPIDFPATGTDLGREAGRLICLIKNGADYHYQPDAARVEDLHVDVGVPGRIYQIGPDFRELPEGGCSFDLCSWLLVTENEEVAERVRARHAAVQPDMAEFATEELEARIAKMTPVLRELGRGQDALDAATKRLAAAHGQRLNAGYAEACRLCEAALRDLRETQYGEWLRMWGDGNPLPPALARTLTSDFYLLPSVVREVAALRAGAWGADRLKGGSFETDGGWHGSALAHKGAGEADFVAGQGRNGSRGLRLASSSPTIYQGKPADWVTADVVSRKVPAAPGEFWELAAWVRVPETFRQTTRGVSIALYAYTAEGKRISGYGAQALEECRLAATEDWQRMQLVVPIRTETVASVAVRLAVCGVGVAILDDVTVRRLEIPGRTGKVPARAHDGAGRQAD